jgi:hypothetical protein
MVADTIKIPKIPRACALTIIGKTGSKFTRPLQHQGLLHPEIDFHVFASKFQAANFGGAP